MGVCLVYLPCYCSRYIIASYAMYPMPHGNYVAAVLRTLYVVVEENTKTRQHAVALLLFVVCLAACSFVCYVSNNAFRTN